LLLVLIMSLRWQITNLLLVTTLVFVASTYLVQSFVVMPAFATLEEQQAIRDVERCVDAISRDVDNLSTIVDDWATWDDSYRYVLGENPEFAAANLIDETFSNTRLNLICLLGPDRELIWGTGA
jgi:sensor domain CHASE-containing protein